MRKGFSLEEREKRRLRALASQPWRHATGPRSATGKAQARANGKLRQIGALSVRERKAQLADVRALIAQMAAARRAVEQRAIVVAGSAERPRTS